LAHFRKHFGRGDSAVSKAVFFDDLDTSAVAEFSDVKQLEQVFREIRDQRTLTDKTHPDFLRRVSWLYPDDGCFARAQIAIDAIAFATGFKLSKLFIFGDLAVKTPNAPHHETFVTWWFHVVVAARLGNEIFVIDPAVDPKAPMLLNAWVKAVAPKPNSVTLSVCNMNTYFPDHSCTNGIANVHLWAVSDEETGYLGSEWARLVELGRDPVKELTDQPPWTFLKLLR
jgi:hypothetical protein